MRSFLGHPSSQVSRKYEKSLNKGVDFIRSKVQSDGGIYGKGLASYNTSICMMALMQARNSEDDSIIQNARKFLINQQSDFDRKGETDNVFDGGVGYGSRWAILIFLIPILQWKLCFTLRKLTRIRNKRSSN